MSLTNNLLKNFLLTKSPAVSNKFYYTIIVERHLPVPLLKKGTDPRKYNLKSRHFQYKLVDCLHVKKWGNIDLILTQYIEGILII
jgi:hypothetical protein